MFFQMVEYYNIYFHIKRSQQLSLQTAKYKAGRSEYPPFNRHYTMSNG